MRRGRVLAKARGWIRGGEATKRSPQGEVDVTRVTHNWDFPVSSAPGHCTPHLLRHTGGAGFLGASLHTWKAWGHALLTSELKSSVLLVSGTSEHHKVLTQMTAREASSQDRALHPTSSGAALGGSSRDEAETG